MRKANLDGFLLHPIFITGIIAEALPFPVLLMYICIVNYLLYSFWSLLNAKMWLDGVARTQMEFWHPKYLLLPAYLPVAKIQPEFFIELSPLNCTLDHCECCGMIPIAEFEDDAHEHVVDVDRWFLCSLWQKRKHMGNCTHTGDCFALSKGQSQGLLFFPAPCCHDKSWQQLCL